MLRFLVKYLLLAIILAALATLAGQWKLKQDLKVFAQAIKPVADFTYESARLTFSGEVRINSASIYLPSLESRVEVGEMRFYAGNLYQLAVLRSNMEENALPDNAYLHIKDLLLPFNDKMINALTSTKAATSTDLISAAFCGNNEHFDFKQIEAMGMDYLSLSGKEFYMLDQYSGSLILSGGFDIEEMFDLEYQVNISGVSEWLTALEAESRGENYEATPTPELSLLEIRKKDAGYNQKKADYCANQQTVNSDEYYEGHVEAVDELLATGNIRFTDEARQAYSDAIQPLSEVTWYLQPQAGFALKDLTTGDWQDLRARSGFQLSVNSQRVSEFFEGWNGESFSAIAGTVLEQRELAKGNGTLYEQVVTLRSFESVNPATVTQYEKLKVRVTRDDGKRYEGILQRSSEKSLWLHQRMPTGDVTIPVARSRIVKLEVYR